MKRILSILMALLIAMSVVTIAVTPAYAGEIDAEELAPIGDGDAPEILSVTPGVKGFVVKWRAFEGAAKYRVFLKNGASWKKLGDAETTSYSHTGLNHRDVCVYTVRAMNNKGSYISGFDSEGVSATFCSAPKINSVAVKGNSLKLSWNALSGVGSYRVFRKNGSSWATLGFTADTTFVDDTVVSGKTYAYTLRAYNAAQTEILSAYDTTGKSAMFVSVPKITKAESQTNRIRVSWKKSAGAKKYRVFLKNGSSWKKLGDTAALTFDHQKPKSNTTYTYSVRALDKAGKYVSDFDRSGTSCRYLSVPVISKIENIYGGQKISWNKIKGAEKYRLYVKNGSSWKTLTNTTNTSYSYTGLNDSVNYAYTVRCVASDNVTFHSAYAPAGKSALYVSAPKITAFENLSNGALITWKKVKNASKYRLFLKKDGKWTKLADVEQTSFLHTKITNKTYIYTIRALNDKGAYISGFKPSGFKNIYIAAPGFSSITPTPDATLLKWNAVTSAAAYRVYRKNINSSWKQLATTEATSFSDTTAPQNMPYTYTLRCVDKNGNAISDFLTTNNFYYNGAVANGTIKVNGHPCTFKNGKLTGGYVTADDIIRTAEAEVGTKASYCKRCKYNTWYYGYEASGSIYDWCAVFVSWVFTSAGAEKLLYGRAANCGIMARNFQNHNQLITKDFKPGDVIFFHWSNANSVWVPGMKTLDHVGIIQSVNADGTYTTIEGNTGGTPNGEVKIQTRYASQISCVGRPKYGFVNAATTTAAKKDLAPSAFDESIPGLDLPGGECNCVPR